MDEHEIGESDFGTDVFNWLSDYVGNAPNAYLQAHGLDTGLITGIHTKSLRIVRKGNTAATASLNVEFTVTKKSQP